MHIVADRNLDSVKIEKDLFAEAVGTGTFNPDAGTGIGIVLDDQYVGVIVVRRTHNDRRDRNLEMDSPGTEILHLPDREHTKAVDRDLLAQGVLIVASAGQAQDNAQQENGNSVYYFHIDKIIAN